MSVVSAVDSIKRTVVYIYSGEAHGEQLVSIRPLGTGFFVAIPHHEDEKRSWPYFVTAKHVLKDTPGEYRKEIFVRANLRGWSSSSDSVGFSFYRLPILNNEGNLQWAIHSNPAVDTAVTQVFPRPETYDFQVIPHALFATQEVVQKEGIAEGDEVFFPCFTPEIPQQRRNNPVIRFGKIALMSGEDIQTQEGNAKFHFAECFPFGGNSGSPVFLRFGPIRRATQIVVGQERYFLFGSMKGYFHLEQPVEIHPTEAYLSVRQSIGIAAITPIDYLKEILYSEALCRQRGEIH
jgi:hypothetical protein